MDVEGAPAGGRGRQGAAQRRALTQCPGCTPGGQHRRDARICSQRMHTCCCRRSAATGWAGPTRDPPWADQTAAILLNSCHTLFAESFESVAARAAPGCASAAPGRRANGQFAVAGSSWFVSCFLLLRPCLAPPLMHSEAQLVAPCTITALVRGLQAHAAHGGADSSGGWSGSHSRHAESTRGQQWMDGRGKEGGTIGRKYKDVWSRSTHAEERRCGASERSWLLRCC